MKTCRDLKAMDIRGAVRPKYRVLCAELAHETNTFCVLPTTLESFQRQVYIEGHEEIVQARTNTKTSIGAVLELQNIFNWDVFFPLVASANPAGLVTNETFEFLCDKILQPLRQSSTSAYDGIVYHLHGAMVTEQFEDAEGELLRRTREIVGPALPIVVTLDLHGNISPLMSSLASALIAVRTYPHVDFYERSIQACNLLQRAMSKEIEMQTILAKLPMIRGLDGGKTHEGSPMKTLVDKGQSLETEDVLVVSVCAGFTAADVYEIGPSVTVTFDKRSQSMQRAIQISKELAKYVWESREYVSSEAISISDTLARVKDYQERVSSLIDKRPMVLADVSDNPGSGHYGDATNLLKAMVEANVRNAAFYAMYDPDAVRQGIEIGIGNSGTISLGGKHDALAGGGPLELTGKVVTLSDGVFQAFGPMGNGVWQNFGLSILFRVAEIDIAIISNNGQILDISQLTSLGCDPYHKTVIAVKSKHHFRATFESFSEEIVLVDGGGLGHVILHGGQYKNIRRPIWPLDDIRYDEY